MIQGRTSQAFDTDEARFSITQGLSSEMLLSDISSEKLISLNSGLKFRRGKCTVLPLISYGPVVTAVIHVLTLYCDSSEYFVIVERTKGVKLQVRVSSSPVPVSGKSGTNVSPLAST